MPAYELPPFGSLDLDNLEEYYEAKVEFQGQPVDLDLNFEGESVAPARLATVRQLLTTLPQFDARNRVYIRQEYEDAGRDAARTYVQHHLQELTPAELAGIVDVAAALSPADQLLSALRLVRVGLYPDGEEQFAIFDYTVSPQLSNYLLVVMTDEHGALDYLTMES